MHDPSVWGAHPTGRRLMLIGRDGMVLDGLELRWYLMVEGQQGNIITA